MLLSVLAVCGTVMSVGAFTTSVARSENDVVLALLQKARSHALTTIQHASWGVCADNTGATYVLFQNLYSPGGVENEEVAMGAHAEASSTPPQFMCERGGVIFTVLSATTSSTTIYIVQNSSTSTISVNHEGTIK